LRAQEPADRSRRSAVAILSLKAYCAVTHDYKRNGTATLFAALNTLDGSVISLCQERTGIKNG
jgi:hypothetical protein